MDLRNIRCIMAPATSVNGKWWKTDLFSTQSVVFQIGPSIKIYLFAVGLSCLENCPYPVNFFFQIEKIPVLLSYKHENPYPNTFYASVFNICFIKSQILKYKNKKLIIHSQSISWYSTVWTGLARFFIILNSGKTIK